MPVTPDSSTDLSTGLSADLPWQPEADLLNPINPALSSSFPSSRTAESGFSSKSYRWNRDRYNRTRRFIDIWTFVLMLLFSFWINAKNWSYWGGVSEAKQAARRRSQAIWIRDTFLDLGPTFIKLGQLFSTRADLFPAEYVEELSKLQDRVPAFSYEQATQIVLEDLNKSTTELFHTFDPIPLAAASLGQVHRAQLHSGEDVVVKVQRPGLRKLFDIDLSILKGIARYFQSHPKWGKGRDWLGVYEECRRILYEEIEYLNEGRNADLFRRNFRGMDWVCVPRVYWRYSSPRVLTLEYLPGIKISHYEALEAAGLDRKRLAQMGAEAYLHQLLKNGFFHADPHPGNIAVNLEGALIFYDFGMMGQIKTGMRERLMEVLFGIAERNSERVINALIDLGALVPTGDVGPVRRSIQYILDNLMDKPFESQSVSAISDDLYEIAYGQPFRFPATFTFVMRAFSTLEGVGKGLDPEFQFMEVAKPFAMELMTNQSNGSRNDLLEEFSRQAAQVGSSALNLPRRLEDTLDKLDRGDLRIRVRSSETDRLLRCLSTAQVSNNYAVLSSAFVIASVILWVNKEIWFATITAVLSILMGIALFRALKRLDRLERMM